MSHSTASTTTRNKGDNLAAELSEYETLRAKNIERNNAKLRALGLISAKEEKQSNDIAWKRNIIGEEEEEVDNEEYNPEEEDNDDDVDADEDWVDIRRPVGAATTTTTKQRKRKKSPTLDQVVSSSPSRKSLRLQGKAPDGITVQRHHKQKSKEELYQERLAMVEECREARQRAALEVAKAGHTIAGKENPTATYEHCLMRVRTMTDKKLINRVKTIERAAGKHCVVKMAIFKSCLQDEEKWDLASLASEALERLKALQPPPSTNTT